MSDKEEYEVESIVEARVEAASRSKKAKLVWKYLVRWKGYGPDDDTLEPNESFAESQHIVRNFWERAAASTGGRDVNDLSLFKAGEKFRPVGPPKRRKRKSEGEHPTRSTSDKESVEPPPKSSRTTSEKRPRTTSDATERQDRQSKRSRSEKSENPPNSSSLPRDQPQSEDSKTRTSPRKLLEQVSHKTTSRKQKQWLKSPSPEVIPDSDEEMQAPTSISSNQNPSTSGKSIRSQTRPGTSRQDKITSRSQQTNRDSDPLQPAAKEPLHRTRSRNPLVKMVDYPESGNGGSAIQTKVHAAAPVNSSPSSIRGNRTKLGRTSEELKESDNNKSSLLTFEKGSLKTIKGKYSKSSHKKPSPPPSDTMERIHETEAEDQAPQVPPSGEELLRLAGLDKNAEDNLSDFHDEADEASPNQTISPVFSDASQKGRTCETKPINNFALAKEKLFPANSSIVFDESTMAQSVSWARPTIFGPLGFGSNSVTKYAQLHSSQPFLTLDTSVLIPLLLSRSDSHEYLDQFGNNDTPGKFYKTEAALTLVRNVRSTGAFAVVDVAENASSDQKIQFLRFFSRLDSGYLFVAVSGTQVLMFCSSNNTMLSQSLSIPSHLANESSKVLVSKVEIQNFSGYADASVNADDTRWNDFIAGTS